ncbi:MAG TPA: hypothetical protein VH478_05910 [Trebonia sp.]|jgi:hypothetical protein|nr:hypothetical protein [Trebonia sp.]
MAALTGSATGVTVTPRRASSAARAGPMSAQPQPGLPRAASASQSAGAPVDHIIPLTAADPPATLPRSQVSARPPGSGGTVG